MTQYAILSTLPQGCEWEKIAKGKDMNAQDSMLWQQDWS